MGSEYIRTTIRTVADAISNPLPLKDSDIPAYDPTTIDHNQRKGMIVEMGFQCVQDIQNKYVVELRDQDYAKNKKRLFPCSIIWTLTTKAEDTFGKARDLNDKDRNLNDTQWADFHQRFNLLFLADYIAFDKSGNKRGNKRGNKEDPFIAYLRENFPLERKDIVELVDLRRAREEEKGNTIATRPRRGAGRPRSRSGSRPKRKRSRPSRPRSRSNRRRLLRAEYI